MKKILAIFVIFIAAAFINSDGFAQRYIKSAEEAARAAKESIEHRRNHATSQIEWLNNVINIVNLNEPAYKDIAEQNNKAIEESR